MREITGREAVAEALWEEMKRDEDVFLLGEDIGVYGGAFGVTQGFLDEFGEERVRETPISEEAITGACVGAAQTGMRPVGEIMFMDFLTIASEQLANQAAKIRYMFGGQTEIPMVLRTPAGAAEAGAQHTQSLESMFAHIPGLVVVMPSTPHDLKGLLKASIRSDDPVLFVEHKKGYNEKGEVPEDEYVLELAEADVKREGSDVTIVATSHQVFNALEAAENLGEEGIDAEVIDPRTLSPLDTDTIVNSVAKTGRAVIVHEAYEFNGIGAEISAQIVDSAAFDYLDAPIKRVAGDNTPVPFSPVLESEFVPDVGEIEEAAKEVTYRNV